VYFKENAWALGIVCFGCRFIADAGRLATARLGVGYRPEAEKDSGRRQFALKERAARDFYALAVDPAVFVREQRSNHRTDIIGHAYATESRHVSDALVQSCWEPR
jgi:hypothetical protein